MWISWLFRCCRSKKSSFLHWSLPGNEEKQGRNGNLEFTHLVYLLFLYCKTWLKTTPFSLPLINWYIFLSLLSFFLTVATTYSTLLKISLGKTLLTPLAKFLCTFFCLANWFLFLFFILDVHGSQLHEMHKFDEPISIIVHFTCLYLNTVLARWFMRLANGLPTN